MIFGPRFLVAAATDVPEDGRIGRLVPFVRVSRALLLTSVFFIEFYADALLFHVTVQHAVNVLADVARVFGRLTVAATTAATPKTIDKICLVKKTLSKLFYTKFFFTTKNSLRKKSFNPNSSRGVPANVITYKMIH